MKNLSFACLILFSCTLVASEDVFSATWIEQDADYVQYKIAVERKQYDRALHFAKAAISNAMPLREKPGLDFAVLNHDVARIISDRGHSPESGAEAIKFLKVAFKVYEKLSPTPKKEVIDLLFLMGKNQLRIDYDANRKRQKKAAFEHFNNSVTLCKSLRGSDAIQCADLQLEIATAIRSHQQLREMGNPYISDALVSYIKKYGKRSIEAATVAHIYANNFWHGSKEALKYYQIVLDAEYDQSNPEHVSFKQLLFKANQQFALYHLNNRQKNKATPYLVALANHLDDPSILPRIFLRGKVDYPFYSTKKTNSAVVELKASVSADGFVTNISPVHSDVDPAFIDSAIDFLESFRYVPRLENGKAVATHDLSFRVDFVRSCRYRDRRCGSAKLTRLKSSDESAKQ